MYLYIYYNHIFVLISFYLQDNEKFNAHSSKNINGERQTLFVISVPGLNDWVCDKERLNVKTSANETSLQSGDSLKRNLHDDSSPEDETIESLNKIKISTKPSSASKESTTSLEYILNSPIPDKLNKACIVKVRKRILI